MIKTLNDITGHLRDGAYKNEEHVRVAIVVRLLEQLGWSIWNPQEVNLEFSPMKQEDSTRIDIAVFMPPLHQTPAIFIEIKAIGRLNQNLESAERQLRDYNRNNQAEICVLTDGCNWRFYLATATGNFSQRCFGNFDLLNPELSISDIENSFRSFLSCESLTSGNAASLARKLLKRRNDEQVMRKALPAALSDARINPTQSLVECFIRRCERSGVSVPPNIAECFIQSELPKPQPNVTSPVVAVENTNLRNKHTNNSKPMTAATSGTPATLLLKGRNGANASGAQLPSGRFVVFAGSICGKPADHFPSHNYYRLYQHLIEEGVLVPLEGSKIFQLSRDYEFDSPSAAAAMFLGRAGNPKNWKSNI